LVRGQEKQADPLGVTLNQDVYLQSETPLIEDNQTEMICIGIYSLALGSASI
jgi:hypothetical protein